MKCKFCGAEVKLGERCQYCGSVAEAFYYKPEEPPEVVGRNGHLHRLPVHIHGRTMHGLWHILEYARLTA